MSADDNATTETVLEIRARDSKTGMTVEEIADAVAQIHAVGFLIIPGVEPRITAAVGWTGGIRKIVAKGSRVK